MAASERNAASLPIELLPEIAHLKSGAAFLPRERCWILDDGPFRARLDFDRIPVRFAAHEVALKRTLLSFAPSQSPYYVRNLFDGFLHFARATQDVSGASTNIALKDVAHYRAGLKEHEAWRIGPMNVVLQKWFALHLPGVDEECVADLRERRKPGNRKGDAVRTHDPVQGPFTEQEYTALYKNIDAAYGAGELPLWAVILSRLLYASGGRTSQYASMKVSDFKASLSADNAVTYCFDLPQVKNGTAHARESFLEFDLAPQTGWLTTQYVKELGERGFDADAALFPVEVVSRTGLTRGNAGLFAGHCTASALRGFFRAAVEPHVPLTERLDYSPLPISPRRFRYSFGTRMAEEGASQLEIAERLGHADLQNVGVYFEASPRMVDSIDKALSAPLAPVAQAFRGRLVTSEEASTYSGAPGTRIIDFRVSTAGVGSCGKGNGCGYNKPVACYTCFKFEPWLDAPHEKVLERLLREREKHAGDPRIAKVNDDAIQAVREVLAECAQAYAGRASAQ